MTILSQSDCGQMAEAARQAVHAIVPAIVPLLRYHMAIHMEQNQSFHQTYCSEVIPSRFSGLDSVPSLFDMQTTEILAGTCKLPSGDRWWGIFVGDMPDTSVICGVAKTLSGQFPERCPRNCRSYSFSSMAIQILQANIGYFTCSGTFKSLMKELQKED